MNQPCAGSSPRMRGKLSAETLGTLLRRIIPAHAGQTTRRVCCGSVPADHPRACGANRLVRLTRISTVGSSPRMRGKLDAETTAATENRIIPAHAGQTSKPSNARTAPPDHPRACGANHPPVQGRERPVRIIPAHAGQTANPSMGYGPMTDHPRACGANNSDDGVKVRADGSSPRMRGKPGGGGDVAEVVRIIPAHAGQTVRKSANRSAAADHPRACGANRLRSPPGVVAGGSSPRMRGKLVPNRDAFPARRIIPAHAGQTEDRRPDARRIANHPRACGANQMLRKAAKWGYGSSPRMRGKLHRSHLRTDVPRIIPAHAGQTRSPNARRVPFPDHPRACGANKVKTDITDADQGSSPRMRGKRRRRQGRRPRIRIIPAHAGQTTSSAEAAPKATDHPRACGANMSSA